MAAWGIGRWGDFGAVIARGSWPWWLLWLRGCLLLLLAGGSRCVDGASGHIAPFAPLTRPRTPRAHSDSEYTTQREQERARDHETAQSRTSRVRHILDPQAPVPVPAHTRIPQPPPHPTGPQPQHHRHTAGGRRVQRRSPALAPLILISIYCATEPDFIPHPRRLTTPHEGTTVVLQQNP
eukprot:scaffold7688_cov130-Isochrysis_galbana.AAC.19